MVPTNNEHLSKAPSTGSTSTEGGRESDATPSQMHKNGIQGEGNYEAAREFNEAERKFVASGRVAAAASAAAPKSEPERLEMIAAEEEGKRRAKGEDPALTKAWPDSATPSVRGLDAVQKRG